MSGEETFEGTVEFAEDVGSFKTTFVGVATGVDSFYRILDEEYTN
jgi:hypothetical protein